MFIILVINYCAIRGFYALLLTMGARLLVSLTSWDVGYWSVGALAVEGLCLWLSPGSSWNEYRFMYETSRAERSGKQIKLRELSAIELYRKGLDALGIPVPQ